MANKTEKDYLEELRITAADKAGMRFDSLADIKNLVKVNVKEVKASLEAYKDVGEVAISSDVLDTLKGYESEIEEIKNTEITPLRSEYTSTASEYKKLDDSIKKQEEQTSRNGVYSLSKPVQDAMHSKKEAKNNLTRAIKEERRYAMRESNVFGRLLGRFLGLNNTNKELESKKAAVASAKRQYKSAKKALETARKRKAEKLKSMAEDRAKRTYLKEKLVSLEDKLQESKGKITAVNTKLVSAKQTLDTQYQLVQQYLRLKSIKEKLNTDQSFRTQMQAELNNDELFKKLEHFELPKNSLVISLNKPLTPDMIASLEGCQKALEKYDNQIKNAESLKAKNIEDQNNARAKIDDIDKAIKVKEGLKDEKIKDAKKLNSQIKEVEAKKDILELKDSDTLETVDAELAKIRADKDKISQADGFDDKNPGEEYEKLEEEEHLLSAKKEYIGYKKKIQELEDEMKELDPKENANLILALNAQKETFIGILNNSLYNLKMDEFNKEISAKKASQQSLYADASRLGNEIKGLNAEKDQQTDLINSKQTEIDKLNEKIGNIKNARQSLEDSQEMITLSEKIEEVERTSAEPNVVTILKQIKEEVEKKLQLSIQSRLGLTDQNSRDAA